MNRNISHLAVSTLIVTSFLVIISGCAQLSQQGMKAKVSLADIRIHEVRALETSFLVELRVLNPNDTPIHVQGIECDLRIDDNHFASGVSPYQQEIPAYGSAIVPVTVYASVLDVLPSVINILQGRTSQKNNNAFQYELSGHIRIGDTNSLKTNLPFESQGELSLNGIR